MLIWVLFAIMTAAAIMAVLAPLGRRAGEIAARDPAAAVYAGQLHDLDDDVASGRLSSGDAVAARAEVARRLIAARDGASAALDRVSVTGRRATALAALIGIPALSLGLYLHWGDPGLPAQPLASRQASPTGDPSVETLVARVEAHLQAKPDDGPGWNVIAPVYLRLGRPDQAADAFRRASALLGPSATRESGLGQALVDGQNGIVSADARAAFERAIKLDKTAPAPRYFLALAAEQDGRRADAEAGWRALLADSPADAPWRQPVEEGLARVTGGPTVARAADGATEAAQPGPSQADVAAASDLSATDRNAMIGGMVTRLAARLKDEPDDVEGWLRLIRSYSVLGRGDDAAAAAGSALAGVSQEADRARIASLVADLGLKSPGGPPGTATP